MKSSHYPKTRIVLDDGCHGLAFRNSNCMKIPLAILAGGQGSRMGLPKGELRIGEQPILQYLLSKWNWPGPTLLVTAPDREHPPAYELFDREVTDPIAGEGPLRGIVTALENCAIADAIIVATCDMPLVTRDMLDHLIAQLLNDADLFGVMTRRGDDVEPFPFAIRPIALELLQTRLAAGARSLHSLAKLDQFHLFPAPAGWSDRVWTNLNHPGDLKRWNVDE